MVNAIEQLLWVAFPYVTIAIFWVGHIVTYTTRRFYWTSRSTQLLQKKGHIVINNIWHIGIIVVLFGHIAGLLVPQSAYAAIGISASEHYFIEGAFAVVFGIMAIVGLVSLIVRSYSNRRVMASLRFTDHFVYYILLAVVSLGLYNSLVLHYHYLNTVTPWVISIFTLHPNAAYMLGVPITVQLHASLAMLLFILWPFSRLSHVWTFPITYIWRPYIQYREY
ncbi:MAG: respiratory nitrate reductase subunit gamma [Caldisphaeraceae archaeon]|nr:respiratory nitrate reductase subunit gamma [Caldisphaeraceae archaeon]MEB3691349.1 respiratory nitrate reductase subunit gamma [Caldisphaeraceae archaeon]MEB3797213.1 respiratory nitrate reductase subunit gamma [Caldisphaeraceae archaeon]